jgi:hypothetical protein
MEKETERLFNETSIENFPSTEKDMDIWVHETQSCQTSSTQRGPH